MILFIKYSNQIKIIGTQLYGFKQLLLIIILSKILNSSVRLIDRILIGSTTPGQTRLEINGNEGKLYIPQ